MRIDFVPEIESGEAHRFSDYRTVVFVGVGQSALKLAKTAQRSLMGCYTGHTYLITSHIDNDKTGRATKTNLPYLVYPTDRYVLYLDADTTVHGSLEPLFQILEDGWDIVIAPSAYQGEQAMHHIGDVERHETLNVYGFNPLQLQGGVIAFRHTKTVESFFSVWFNEWLKHREQDQAALLRALHGMDLNVWIVGNAFNGGEVIQHHFGSIK